MNIKKPYRLIESIYDHLHLYFICKGFIIVDLVPYFKKKKVRVSLYRYDVLVFGGFCFVEGKLWCYVHFSKKCFSQTTLGGQEGCTASGYQKGNRTKFSSVKKH